MFSLPIKKIEVHLPKVQNGFLKTLSTYIKFSFLTVPDLFYLIFCEFNARY